jgi:hypothetical protein
MEPFRRSIGGRLSHSVSAAAWTVDAGLIRSTLDSLHTALARASPVSSTSTSTAALSYDKKQLAEAVRGVLAHLDAHPQVRLGVGGAPTEFRDPAQMKRIDTTVRELQGAWRRRAKAILGEQRIGALRELLAHPAPDLLTLLGRGHDENSHSDIVRWLLSPASAPNVAPFALRGLVQLFDNKEHWAKPLEQAIAMGTVSVRREYVYGREWENSDALDRIDLVVTAPGFTIAIENKVWATEHDAQTQTYWSWLSRLPGLKGGIFLTPTGMTAACLDFKPLSYLELTRVLLEAATRAPISETERVVLAGYLKTLTTTILRTELRAVCTEGDR